MVVVGELLLLLVVVVGTSVVVGCGATTAASSTARSDPKLSGTKSAFAAHISLLFRQRGSELGKKSCASSHRGLPRRVMMRRAVGEDVEGE